MKVILLSLGTRGDIEPFLVLAKRLKRSGHRVICAFPFQFQELVQEMEIEFYGLSEKFLELIEGEKAKMVLGGKGTPFQKLGALAWIIRESQAMQKEVIIQQHDLLERKKPDLVIYNQKCLYPMVWGVKNKGATILLSPIPCTIHEFEGHASLGMGSDHGALLNKLTYRFSNFFLFQTIHSSNKKYYKELGLRLNPSKIKKHILYEEKMVYTVSPVLFPRPSSWPENAEVAGYHERSRRPDWTPPRSLQSFIEKYEKIVFITFGSMTNPAPEQKTQDILSILSKHQIPAIINTASGGLIQPEAYPEHVIFTDNIPYDWVFPKMYAVIHHGGSGTTHTAVKYGCANLIIPHILDQHLWSDLISSMGLGPKGLPIRKFNASRFENKLLEVLNESTFKEKTEEIGAKMTQENFNDYLLKTIMTPAKTLDKP